MANQWDNGCSLSQIVHCDSFHPTNIKRFLYFLKFSIPFLFSTPLAIPLPTFPSSSSFPSSPPHYDYYYYYYFKQTSQSSISKSSSFSTTITHLSIRTHSIPVASLRARLNLRQISFIVLFIFVPIPRNKVSTQSARMHRVVPRSLSPFLRRPLSLTPPSHSYRLRRRVHQIIQSLARLLHHFLRHGRQFLWHEHHARIQVALQLQEALYASNRMDGGTFVFCFRVFGFLKHNRPRMSTLIDATY